MSGVGPPDIRDFGRLAFHGALWRRNISFGGCQRIGSGTGTRAMINRQFAETFDVVDLPGYQRPWLRTERTGGVERALRKVLMVSHTPGPLRRATAMALTGGVVAFDLAIVESLPAAIAVIDEPSDAIVIVLDGLVPSAWNTCRRLHERASDIPIVVVASSYDDAVAVEAIANGAQDCVVQERLLGVTLPRAIRLGIERNRRRQVSHLGPATTAPDPQAVARLGRLTNRQREISELLIRGRSIKQIAAQLDIGIQAATKHRATILRKCEVDSVVHLVRLTLAAGLPIE
jgi:FixJ family two-component response regulator